ncbi:MFS general substrate transporter [Microthyrium microscopicum]|uniref:MFS general substrate transporter n=1 Tax=Microthyrium microscopicum TaxID=703497 RepID=A0A6A6U5L1_9PEZI|nr:MFS general substrate transporter [Microthyrium microscopicum]
MTEKIKTQPQVTDTECQLSTHASDISEQDIRRLIRKIDWMLLPLVCFLNLLSFLDRGNIGNARLAGLEKDLNLKGLQYNAAVAILYPFYALSEAPSNVMIKRVRPSVWLSFIMLVWGGVCIAMGFVRSYSGLLIVRAVLGFTEGGLLPGIVFYITMWYRREELGFRLAILVSAVTAAGAFGGFLARAIMLMDGVGGRSGWSWIFIIEGLLTVVVAIAARFLLQDYPATAKFLSPAERHFIVKRIAEDQGYPNNDFDMKHVWQAFKDWKIYVYATFGLATAVPSYSIAVFLPTIIKGLKSNYSNTATQLMTTPPFLVGCLVTVIGGVLSDRTKRRGNWAIGFCCVGMIGFLMLLSTTNPHIQYAGCFFVISGIFPATPLGLAWASSNISNATKRAVSIAIYLGFTNLGGTASAFVYAPRFAASHYKKAHAINFTMISVAALTCIVLVVYFSEENAKREAARPCNSYTDEERIGDGDKGEDAGFFRYTL